MKRGAWAGLFLLLAGTHALAGGTSVPAKPRAAPAEDCFHELEHGTDPILACVFKMQPSAGERAELEAGSRGYVKDVACRLSVTIARAEIDKALQTMDATFKIPEQPVVCTITTYKSTFDITGTFAPEVTFEKGVAVAATPGLGNVKGITRAISWPVVQFVNRWPSVRAGMLTVVNAYRAHKSKAQRQP